MFKQIILIFITAFIFILSCSNMLSKEKESKSHKSQKLTLPKVAVQLYSVRESLKQNYDGTLQKIAVMGFSGVEFAKEFGPYANNPQALKKRLDELKLQAFSAHVRFEHLSSDSFAETVTFYKILGVKDLIVSWDDRSIEPKDIQSFADDLNALAKKLKPHGMRVGYHNHDDEFAKFQDETFWDFLAKATTQEVILQLDVGWAVYANKDPVAYVKKYPHRTVSTHYKAKLPKDVQNKQPLIGEDVIDWQNLLLANIHTGGTAWLILEQEDYPMGLSDIESVARSKQGLDKVIHDFTQPTE